VRRRAPVALAALALCAALAAACSDARRESRAAVEAYLAGHGAVDTAMEGRSSMDPDDGLDDAMDAVDHPLVRGRLSGAEAEARLAAFARDWDLAHEDGSGTVRVFRKYVADLGVARLARHFEARRHGCHGELHNLGKVVAERTGDAATAMAVCADACTYACIHGALKAHYAARARDEGGKGVAHARDDLVALCTEGALINGFYRGNCAHAAGHAFAIMAEDVRGALDLCATFPGREYAYYCATGAFMQVTPVVERNLDAKADAAADPADARLDYCREATRFLGA
jgi:hypothetical protein